MNRVFKTLTKNFINIKDAVDFVNAFKKDPALRGKVFGIPELLTYAGLWAITFHRIAHVLYVANVPFIPRLLSQISR